MKRYLVRRLIQSALVVWGLTVVTFIISHLSGDPAQLMMSFMATPADVEHFRRVMGLADPWWVQYWRFFFNALRGDFGNSFQFHMPVLPLVWERLPATFELAGGAMGIAILFGVPIGIVSALKRGSFWDKAGMFIAMLSQSMPGFWLGLMFIFLFAVQLHWLPAGGRGGLRYLVLPAVTLSAYSLATVARLSRSSMLEVLAQDYIRTARSKGVAETAIVVRHALKNAAIPVITVIGYQFGTLLGGAVVTETIFSWPGVGRLAIGAITNRDFPLVQGVVVVVSFFFIIINFLVDLLYHWFDPTIRAN
jgi:peptide/nickel transport system permease protein